jgi:hypothetical protein
MPMYDVGQAKGKVSASSKQVLGLALQLQRQK